MKSRAQIGVASSKKPGGSEDPIPVTHSHLVAFQQQTFIQLHFLPRFSRNRP